MAARLLASVWCLLLLGSASADWLGADAARLGSFSACAALLVSSRPPGRRRASPLAALPAGVAGFLALPAWLAFVWLLGSALGLGPAETPRASPDVPSWLANVALAPLFEELLYRERLLPALRARIGAPLALVASSALFAAPHGEPWSLLTTFSVGLALGAAFLAAGHVAPCIAYHAGLNAAALWCGLPPERAALGPLAAAVAGGLLLALGCLWTRSRAACPGVCVAPARARTRVPTRAWRLHRPGACPRSRSGS
jgi:membrane protease YdiL (CAAX protease family)